MLISLASLSRLASLALVPVENSLDAVAGVLGIDIEPPPRPSTSSAPATPPTQDTPSLPSLSLSVSPSTSTSFLKTLLLVEKLNNGEIDKKSTTSPESTPMADTFAGLATLKRVARPARPHPQHLLDTLPFPLVPVSRSPVPVSGPPFPDSTTTTATDDVDETPKSRPPCPSPSVPQPSPLKARATIGSGTAGSSTSSTSTSMSSGYHLRPIAGNSRTKKSNPAFAAVAVSRPSSSAAQSPATVDPIAAAAARREEWSRAIDDANMAVIRRATSSPSPSGDQIVRADPDAVAPAASAKKKKKHKNNKKKNKKPQQIETEEAKAEAEAAAIAPPQLCSPSSPTATSLSTPTSSDSALSQKTTTADLLGLAVSIPPSVDLSAEAMKAEEEEVERLHVDLARMRSLMGRASGVERVLRAALVNALIKGGGADAGGASSEQRKKKTKVVPREGRRAAV